MAPKTEEEKSRVFHILQVGTCLNDFHLVILSHSSDTTEDTSQFTDSEHVVELSRCR